MVKAQRLVWCLLVVGCGKAAVVPARLLATGCEASQTPALLGVRFVEARLTAPDLPGAVTLLTAMESGGLLLPEVPAGEGRVLEVRAYDAAPADGGVVVAFGRSLPFSTPRDREQVVPTVNVFMRRVGLITRLTSQAHPTTCSTMMEPRLGHSASLLPSGLLVAGGLTTTDAGVAPTAHMELLDLSSGEVVRKKDLSVTYSGSVLEFPRVYGTATRVKDLVYFWGGSSSGPSSAALAYHAGSNEVAALTAANSRAPRARHSVAVDQAGHLFIAGGVGTGGVFPSLEGYDTTTGLQVAVTDGPLSGVDLRAITLPERDIIVTTGGSADGGVSADVHFYSWKNSTWQAQSLTNPPHLSSPRVGAVLAATRNLALVAGGVVPGSDLPVDTVEVISALSGLVTTASDAGIGVEPCSVTLENGDVLVAGGYTTAAKVTTSNTLTMMRLSAAGALVMQHAPPLPHGLAEMSCSRLHDGSVLFAGGTKDGHTPLDELWVYRPSVE